MNSARIRIAVVAVTLLGAAAMMQMANGADLTAQVKVMRGRGAEERPEETSSFTLGDTVVCTYWAKGYEGNAGGGGMDVIGAWSFVDPDGEALPLQDTGIAAVNSDEVGPDGVLLRPVKGWGLPANAKSGCYWAQVSVTDKVSRATATAKAPLYVFLTAGARDQITAPTEKAPLALDTTLLAPGFWDLSLDHFAGSTWKHGFAWVSEAHDEVRSTLTGLTFLDQPVVEALVRFEKDRPAEVKLSLYNRGDSGFLSNESFNERVKQLKGKVTGLVRRPPRDLSATAKRSARMKQSLLVWKHGPSVLRLDYAWSKLKREGERRSSFQPEYVNMAMLPAAQARTSKAMAGTQAATVSRLTLPRNVRKLPNGDVYIDGIPMVDQGEKGYCAAAAAERIFSYYGTDTDQHELAQRMLMETGGGASYESLVKGLRSIAHALKVQLKMITKSDGRAFQRLIDDYNKEAKRRGVPPIDPHRKKTESSYDEKVNIWTLFDRDIFLASRLKEKVRIKIFMKTVQTRINKGIPICQCCVIGILPEERKLEQEPGGHLRLIIGYNAKTSEILYTDSWGPGHEMKRLPLEEAYAITTGLFTLEPK